MYYVYVVYQFLLKKKTTHSKVLIEIKNPIVLSFFIIFKHFMEHSARKHLIRHSLTIGSVVWFIVTKLGKCQFTFTFPTIPCDAQTFTKAIYKDRIHSLLTSLIPPTADVGSDTTNLFHPLNLTQVMLNKSSNHTAI